MPPTSKMYATIHRESADMRRLAAEGWGQAEAAAELLGPARRVFAVGIGTSYHAALNAEYQLRLAGCNARAVSSFDFALYPPRLRPGDAVLLFAHTGLRRY